MERLEISFAAIMPRVAIRIRRLLLHLFGLGSHGLAEVHQHAARHRASVMWTLLLTTIHVAAGSHDTLSLLGLIELKPEVGFMRTLEITLTGLVWIGHLLGDD